jgi:hypothetical protein
MIPPPAGPNDVRLCAARAPTWSIEVECDPTRWGPIGLEHLPAPQTGHTRSPSATSVDHIERTGGARSSISHDEQSASIGRPNRLGLVGTRRGQAPCSATIWPNQIDARMDTPSGVCDPLPVGRPHGISFAGSRFRKAARNIATALHHVDVPVPSFGAISGEHDRATVGRPRRLAVYPATRGQTSLPAAIAGHRPDPIPFEQDAVVSSGGRGSRCPDEK